MLNLLKTSFHVRRIAATFALIILMALAMLIMMLAPATKDIHTAIVMVAGLIALGSGCSAIWLIVADDKSPSLNWLKPR
ncbi:MAG: hypothetical protein UU08_C0014G0022 [Candidatus Uhrbacteria bacterium GW2011_GWE2_40_58]|nr:MAG: hypothetical protein UU08_C0014G0022 [Candidatus Uhrbacteria bacterium GW2011_GWE2_40_58]OGL96475.1 MAG: hypothetical protein A2332_04830 [Candidatus Uhrbacteria bacterium RIFOXYB2_FULL_41_18]HBK34574.1 hypothetical protein [Candidatus Uhrbacteria bacterium]HCB55387.1 hypothetical protein [Candidatus Uhrbacteria bacterium]